MYIWFVLLVGVCCLREEVEYPLFETRHSEPWKGEEVIASYNEVAKFLRTGDVKIFQEGTYVPQRLENFLSILEDRPKTVDNGWWTLRDIFEKQLNELFDILNPGDIRETTKRHGFIKKRSGRYKGSWIFIRHLRMAFHILNEEEYNLLRFNRNRNLVTSQEQKILEKIVVGVAGSSVGSNIVHTLVSQGISIKSVKIADFDVFETSNLNRMRGGLPDLYRKKTDFVKQKIIEFSPYTKVHVFEGLTEENIDEFMKGLDFVVDEIDDFPLKLLLRKKAKESRIPVLSMASVHDRVIANVERYDLSSKTKPLNGIIEDSYLKELENGSRNLTLPEINNYAKLFVGEENVSNRALESLKQIGKTLSGRPQLSTTVTLAASVCTFLVRSIALKKDDYENTIQSGNYVYNLNRWEKKVDRKS